MAISFSLPVRRESLALLASGGVKVEPLSTTANKHGLLTLILIPLVLQLGGRVRACALCFYHKVEKFTDIKSIVILFYITELLPRPPPS